MSKVKKKVLETFFQILDHKDEKIVKSLRALSFFKHLSDKELRILAKKCYIRYFQPEEEIYPENSPAAAVYFVVSGSVGMFKKRRSEITDRVQVIRSGMFFGDASIVGETTRKHSAQALEKTQTIVLFKSDFDEMELTAPQLALALVKIITQKYYSQLLHFQTEFHELSQKIAKDELMR